MSQLSIKTLTIGRFYPPHFGGVERHIELLLEGLSAYIQADCIVVNNCWRHQVIQLPNREIQLVPALFTVASTPICPTMPFIAKKLHEAKHYDILHLHLPNPMAHLIAYCLPKNIKLVITWHSDIIRQKHLLRLYSPFLRHLLKKADIVTAATPKHFSSSQQLQAWCDPDKFRVVPFGLNNRPFIQESNLQAAQAIRLQFPEKNILFSLGRHVYYKGFEYLIEAMQYVNNTVLILGGSGPLTAKLKNTVQQLRLSEKVIFPGAVAEDMLPAYYYACDIFCMPSVEQTEALGIVQMEAMACKKPVICCELNNGVTYINKHNETGLVVPPRDAKALADAINFLLDAPELRQKMGAAGFTMIATEYSIRRMCEETLQVYKQLLD